MQMLVMVSVSNNFSATLHYNILIQHDSELAKNFFTTVYKTVKPKLKGFNTILQSIEHIFNSSIQYNGNVFSTMIDILMKSKADFRVDPSLIAQVSQQSGLVSVGEFLTYISEICWGFSYIIVCI